MNSELKFYEGVRGSGVVTSITYGSSRVIFDFGAPYEPFTYPYDGQLEKREKGRVRDAIRLGQIPPVEGVFAEQELAGMKDISPCEGSRLTAGVIISHLHLDHMSGIGMVHPSIPVYMHRDAYQLQTLLNDIGESVGERDYSPIDLHEPFCIGEIAVTAYLSDHPCAGSVGYLIETPDAKFYYSGDVRFHGNNRGKALQDLEKIAQEEVDVLILEATTFSESTSDLPGDEPLAPTLDMPEGMMTEGQLLDWLLDDLRRTAKLGVFNIYHRDLRLMQGLIRAAEEVGRDIVFEPKTAHIVANMLGFHPPLCIPDNEEYSDHSKPYLAEALKHAPYVITRKELNGNPGRYLLQNSYENILELFDLPSKATRYYHLYGVPLVRGARDFENMERVIDFTGVEYACFANLYCYNHAHPNHLLYMADRIRARYLIAVHSTSPEKLVSKHSKQLLPAKGEVYRIQDGDLVLSTEAEEKRSMSW